MLELVKPWDESLKTMTSFLPGICCRMTKLACSDLNTAVVNVALKIFGCTVTTCLNDSVHKQDKVENSTVVESNPKNSGDVSKKNITRDENLKVLVRHIFAT
ncbi:unnamed protein product [Brugia pahangi]|uniref:DZF domain-containing protein n=1 Tax=Brugia pahangi TaxID=6280 RepID=A0A0N4TF27_BRUPA|nr:unnamed protein product [Brugia pahangi]